jgi:GNAT superfamily N-acetyltransferase
MTAVPLPPLALPACCKARILGPHDDPPALLEGLLARCTPETVHHRFLLHRPPDPGYARTALLPHLQVGLMLGALEGEQLVGLLNLIGCGPRTIEIGLLVADDWQRFGIGTALLARSRALRSWSGWSIQAEVDRNNVPVMALLRRHGRCEIVSQSGWEITYRLAW